MRTQHTVIGTDTLRTRKGIGMAQKLTDAIVKALVPPATGNRIEYDDQVKGFGARITASGSRAFILNYRTRAGRERRITIGSFPDWKVAAARQEATELKKRIDRGEDPLGDLQEIRSAPTVSDLADRFIEEHLPKLRSSTQVEYQATLRKDILPAIGRLKVADVSYSDIDALHRRISQRAPVKANRSLAVLGKMFTLAIKWRLRSDNPTIGIDRNPEEKRHRYLSADELACLTVALAHHHDQQAVSMIRLLLLTGARRGEVRAARWDQFDLDAGVWTKLPSSTKQKRMHRLPLSAPARQLLIDLRTEAEKQAEKDGGEVSEWVFPGDGATGHRLEIKKNWASICEAAGIVDLHVHDLRHSFASMLVSAGHSLPLIGALLGHSEVRSTQRYAHLADDPLRAATERVGAIVSGKPSAEIISIKGSR